MSNDRSHSSEGVGEGIISIFVIAGALYDSRPGDVVIIDEPELSLHPQTQRRLMRLIEKFAADRQIIIATHSPYFVSGSALDSGCVIARTWDRAGGIALFQTSSRVAESGLQKLVVHNANNPHVFGLDAREVFFLDDRVLVFEGQEDVVFWPSVHKDFQAAYNLYGWGAGGASNIRWVLELLRDLGFEKVAAILDSDRAADVEQLSLAFPTYFTRAIEAPDIRTKKATAAKAQKLGLLNDRKEVRPEYAEATNSLLCELTNFMSS